MRSRPWFARDARRTRFVPEYLEVIHDRTTLGESQDVVEARYQMQL